MAINTRIIHLNMIIFASLEPKEFMQTSRGGRLCYNVLVYSADNYPRYTPFPHL
jgi:hypothetical protein